MSSGTLSAQVRIPVGNLVPPPRNYAHTILLGGKIIRERQRKVAAGVREIGGGRSIRRWRKNYPAAEYLSLAGAGGPKIRKKIRKNLSAENCRTVPKIPYSIS